MVTDTITAGFDRSRRVFFPLKYEDDIPMINKNQKQKLTALIYQNISDENEREYKLSELDDLTSGDADYALYQFSIGRWS